MNNYKLLNELWKDVYNLNNEYFPENKLMPIFGNGKSEKPKIMFIFINPTSKNISSNPEWNGPRFPFIGTKQIWRIFHKAGLFDDELMTEINMTSIWPMKLADDLLRFLQKKEFYITNIVKWTGYDASLPDAKKIELFLPILEKEIEIVQPEYIVTFGLIPFERLTKQKIKLSEYYNDIMKKKKLKFFDIIIRDTKSKIIPCYFPVGRGNPKQAVDILKLMKNTILIYRIQEPECKKR